ncbi:MAG: YkgB family protein [Gemmatimonadota bacterium]|nr:YkgB family protein [Gemmatimonadota bacterium]
MATAIESSRVAQESAAGRGPWLEASGAIVLRYGLVVVLLWVGGLKFTVYEAKGVYTHASNSPILSWAYELLSVRGVSMLLGLVEILLAILIATRPVLPKISAIGSLGAIVMFVITLTLLLTTPGVWQPDYRFPALSPMPGQFLAKDLVLLGAAMWTAGEALRAARMRESG